MKIGLCTSVDKIDLAEKMGFDYIEPSVTEILQMDKGQFQTTLERVKKANIPCGVFNILFPGEIRLTGPGVDHQSIREHLIKAFDRISQLGARIVVFGSGGARKVPEDWEYKDGWNDLVQVARIVGDVAAEYDILIAMEPLNQRETNIINSISEGISFLSRVDHPNIRLLADFYHMRMENESMDILEGISPDILIHTHIAKGDTRYFPVHKDEDIYGEFFLGLKRMGYKAKISIEGQTDDIEGDGPRALEILRQFIG